MSQSPLWGCGNFQSGRGDRIEQSRPFHVSAGVEDDQAVVQQVAREHIERFGRKAPDYLRERAEQAELIGDQLSADAWREIAEAAERML